jgi:hypothetical protein
MRAWQPQSQARKDQPPAWRGLRRRGWDVGRQNLVPQRRRCETRRGRHRQRGQRGSWNRAPSGGGMRGPRGDNRQDQSRSRSRERDVARRLRTSGRRTLRQRGRRSPAERGVARSSALCFRQIGHPTHHDPSIQPMVRSCHTRAHTSRRNDVRMRAASRYFLRAISSIRNAHSLR